MQLGARPIAPQETDFELLWLSVSIGAAVCAATWLTLGLPWPTCLFLAFTGHPCLTCGATRAAIQFAHGNFMAALRWNPFVFLFLWGVVLFDLYAIFVLVGRAPRLRITNLTAAEKNSVRLLVILALLINWIYLLSRPAGTY
jgi:hypothetical protein